MYSLDVESCQKPDEGDCVVSETFVFGPPDVAVSLRFNPLNANSNPICHLLALLGAHHVLHVSRIRVNCTHNTCFNIIL
jgi:hypothetical protein